MPESYPKAGTMIHHIPPHVIWMHIYEGREMNQSDQAHVVECSRCLETFIVCLKSESFASVLEALPEELKAV
jgi:hypothetical protein